MGLNEKKRVFQKLKMKGKFTPETFKEKRLEELKVLLEDFYKKISAFSDGKTFSFCDFCASAYAGEILDVIDTIDVLNAVTNKTLP